MAVSDKAMRLALARAVANRKVPNQVVAKVAKKLSVSKLDIRGIDICVYGICLDYIIDRKDWWEAMPDIMAIRGTRIRDIHVFPWGIPVPDVFHVQVEHEISELAPYMESHLGG
jgi:hypothetical protein